MCVEYMNKLWFGDLDFCIDATAIENSVDLLAVRVRLESWGYNWKSGEDYDTSISNVRIKGPGSFILNLVKESSFHSKSQKLLSIFRKNASENFLQATDVKFFKTLYKLHNPFFLPMIFHKFRE